MTAAHDPGPMPELAWLPVAKCAVDPVYQRTLESTRSQALIARIVANFSWAAFQAVLAVKKKGGTWIIIDGQHRIEAARLCGIAHVPGIVVSAESVAAQAAAFVQANSDRVAVNAFALHHARVVAGDETAKTVDRVCRVASVTIPKYPIPADKLRPGQTLALVTIARLARTLGENAAALVLHTIMGAYATEPGAIKASLITALGKTWENTPTQDVLATFDRIPAWLKRHRAAELCASAVQRKQSYGGTEVTSLVEMIRRGIGRNPRAPQTAAETGGIRQPTLAQRMGRR